MSYIVKGLILGFVLSAPIGPIGLLVINRTIRRGHLYGFASGLGATFADVIYGCIAAFSFTAVIDFLISHRSIIEPVGCIAICLIGVKIFFSKTKFREVKIGESKSILGSFSSAFLLMITNPVTILFFIAVFSTLGLDMTSANYFGISIFILGVFLGSAGWWLFLSGSASFFAKRISGGTIGVINRISGSILILLGILGLMK